MLDIETPGKVLRGKIESFSHEPSTHLVIEDPSGPKGKPQSIALMDTIMEVEVNSPDASGKPTSVICIYLKYHLQTHLGLREVEERHLKAMEETLDMAVRVIPVMNLRGPMGEYTTYEIHPTDLSKWLRRIQKILRD